MSAQVTCSMCGFRFDPQAHLACQACPLNTGCQVVCCPSCGYQWADPQRSALARLAGQWLERVTTARNVPTPVANKEP